MHSTHAHVHRAHVPRISLVPSLALALAVRYFTQATRARQKQRLATNSTIKMMRAASIVLGISSVSSFSSLGSFDRSSVAGSDNNNFIFKNAGQLNWKAIDSSSTKKIDKITTSGNTLTVATDRHAGTEPAAFFIEGLSPDEYIGYHSSATPGHLNFAVTGDVSMRVGQLDLTCSSMHLGQGHIQYTTYGINNWWLGKRGCTHAGSSDYDGYVVCGCTSADDEGNTAQVNVKFETTAPNEYTVTLPGLTCVADGSEGSWVSISAAPGTYTSSFSHSKESFTEEEVLLTLTATFDVPLSLGNLQLSASAAASYKSTMKAQIAEKKGCSITLLAGQRLWEWRYFVRSNNCGTAAINSCYFKIYKIDDSRPCCLSGYETNDPNVCTEPMRNMCTGE